ncbi:hypothetical protein [Actinoplanes sp. CA-252034]|uniref:hypothetical protein n=1 Tax=Actinoplanes sp. CA-252034 TaxID=3239906 RepID=UPI003D97C51A
MSTDFQVDTEGLRQDATAVTAFADRITGATASAPAADPSPHWAATAATTLVTDATRRMVTALAHDTAETASHIREAATAYEQADARAATRLTSTGTTVLPAAPHSARGHTGSRSTTRTAR